MNKGKSYRSLYLPAWTIVAAVLTLLLIIAISTYRNMSRETGRMEDSLVREGLVIIRAIEASVRADFPTHLPDNAERLQKLVEEVAREPEVAVITIFDNEGNIIATSSPAGQGSDKITGVSSIELLLQERGMVTRYGPQPDGTQFFEIIRPFRPFAYPAPPLSLHADEGMRFLQETPLQRWAAGKVISLSLRLATFETARREDRHHTLLMAAILVVLGTGALYFISVVQNYYLVDRTLDRMKSYTENVVESMADGLISIDREGRIVTLNRQAVEILAAGRERLEGRTIADVMGEGAGEIVGLAKGPPFVRDQEVNIRRPDGLIPLNLSVAPLRDENGQEMGSVLLIKDLREIRDLQEKVRRSERLASLGRLAAGVAHEIRNPLSSIRGFAQYFVKRFHGQPEDEGYAAVMVKEVDRLDGVITELLDFAGPKEPRRELQSPEEIIEHVLKLLASDLSARRVEVERDYEPGMKRVLVDRDRISQVFLNIILNALESMDGGGKISITLRRCGSPPAVEIAITDTGTGIPAEDLEKVFEPFFSTKRKGTGLGLAIVHQIIESHGGSIRAESTPGRGTTFRIYLPAEGDGDQRGRKGCSR